MIHRERSNCLSDSAFHAGRASWIHHVVRYVVLNLSCWQTEKKHPHQIPTSSSWTLTSSFLCQMSVDKSVLPRCDSTLQKRETWLRFNWYELQNPHSNQMTCCCVSPSGHHLTKGHDNQSFEWNVNLTMFLTVNKLCIPFWMLGIHTSEFDGYD